MIFSFIKKKSSLSLVFDIRDAVISVAAVKFACGEKPEIILCQNFKAAILRIISCEKCHKSYIGQTTKFAIFAKNEKFLFVIQIYNKKYINDKYRFIDYRSRTNRSFCCF